MKNDLNQLKKVTNNLINGNSIVQKESNIMDDEINKTKFVQKSISYQNKAVELKQENENILTLQEQEIKMIKESLQRHQGRRKDAADELGISERTLYRKIKEYKL